MGFFAVLEKSNQPSFEVEKLDINLWCLPGIFGEAFFCDIGILINIDDSVDRRPQFELGLPFGTYSDGYEDLAKTISDPNDGRLVFGESLEVSPSETGHTNVILQEAEETYCIAELESSCKLKRDESDPNFSIWELEPALDIDGTSHPIYMRLRFSVRSLGRLWKWRKTLSRHGAVVDLRISDLRGSFDVPEGQDYSDRISNIKELNCFVIVPIYFPVQKVNPGLKYMRLLEGRRWESYLGRATDFFRRGKLQVVFLRGEDIGTNNEFRGTVSLSSKSNTGWITWTFAAVLFSLLLLFFSSPDDISNTLAHETYNSLSELFSSIWRVLVGTLSVGVILTLLSWVSDFKIAKRVSIIYSKVVHLFYRFIAWVGSILD